MHTTSTKKKYKKPTIKKGYSKKKRKSESLTDITGIHKLIISPSDQHSIGLVIDEDVFIEKPWKFIRKDLIEINLELNEEESCFHQLKNEIYGYNKSEILLGYNVNVHAQNVFYIILSDNAEMYIEEMIAKKSLEAYEKELRNVSRTVGKWISLGSEEDVTMESNTNNRELFEVQITSRYPIIIQDDVKLKYRYVDDVRDGYAELTYHPTFKITNIQRKMMNVGIQVAALSMDNYSQTYCAYPENKAIQYEYDFEENLTLTKEWKNKFKEYLKNDFDKLLKHLNDNSAINLYTNDYKSLVKCKDFTESPITKLNLNLIMCLQDITLSTTKQISSYSWHNYLSGTIVISYVEVANNVNLQKRINIKEEQELIFEKKPVFLWSFSDELNYKLYLDAPFEVTYISCCPFDKDIIVGGLRNGQIIIWDIRGKFEDVEHEEFLTTNQMKYRLRLHYLIRWMKKIKDTKLVNVTALSNMYLSHMDTVTDIQWIPENYEILPNGCLNKLTEKKSLQFMTSSFDGCLLFWDLNVKVHGTAHERPMRRMRRLKERPAIFARNVSPYRALDRAFRPIFKLNVTFPERDVPMPITSFFAAPLRFKYNYIKTEIHADIPRYIYGSSIDENLTTFKPFVAIANPFGTLTFGTWEGFDYTDASKVLEEYIKIDDIACYHDGPIVSVQMWQENAKYILSVGGKTFAIWNTEYKEKPMLWRKGKATYCCGHWGKIYLGIVILTTVSGMVEYWDIGMQSWESEIEYLINPGFINGQSSAPLPPDKCLAGFTDSHGSFRVFRFPVPPKSDENKSYLKFLKLMKKNYLLKISMKRWKTEWLHKFKNDNLPTKSPELSKLTLKSKVEIQSAISVKPIKTTKKPYEQKRIDYIQKETEKMKLTLLALNNLNPELCRIQQEPLNVRDREEAIKKNKQRKMLSMASKIFYENVASNFPIALEKTPLPPIDPYAGGDSADCKQQCFNKFIQITLLSTKYVDLHPFYYNFDWHKLLEKGYRRQEIVDNYYHVSRHKDRYRMYLRTLNDVGESIEIGSVEDVSMETEEF